MVESDPKTRRPAVGLLEIVGLWCLAVLQPLTGLIGHNAPFLLHYRTDGLDLAIWLTIAALVAPLLLWLVVETTGRLRGEPARSRAQSVVLSLLLVLMALGILRRLGDPLPPWLVLPLAISGVWLGADLIGKSSRARWLFAALALAVPVVGALFWTSPAAVAAMATAEDGQGMSFEAASRPRVDGVGGDSPPVVIVVFDELPLVSILDGDLSIDADLCPNLAALSQQATWFRNAATVWSITNPSIVSLLIGGEADRDTPPTRQSYPENLLTWLEPTHEVRAFERLTAMAPMGAVELQSRPARAWRVRGLSLDSMIVAAHQVLPPELGGWLPPIDNRWGDFWNVRVVRGRPDPDAEPLERTPWTFALTDAREREFDAFLASIESGEPPGLHFAHVMLPHMPYRYLPSGRVYGGRAVYDRASTAWMENDWFALDTYQRHLLQVGFVDHLVGRLVERLRTLGLWDRSLVVITSDHGASHWPGQDRRLPLETAHPDDILRVPLLVKLPGQVEGGVDDRAASTVDIAPTIAAALARSLPWPVAGRSLLAEEADAGERRLNHPGGDTLTYRLDFAPDRQSLARKLELFDPGAAELRWVRFGPYRRFIGLEVAALAELAGAGTVTGCRAEVDQLPALAAWDPDGRYSPVRLTGALACDRDLPPDTFVLAAVNGRVAGSGAVQQIVGGKGLFAVMTTEEQLRAGANELHLFLAHGAPETVRLEATAAPSAPPGS